MRPALLAICFLLLTRLPLPAQSLDKGIGVRDVAEAVQRLPANVNPGKRFALIIGASQFEDDAIPDLAQCENDARAIQELLVDPRIGMFPENQVRVILGKQVTRGNVIEAFEDLARKAGPDDLALVFFTGHGTVDARGRGYWLMQDTQLERSLRATAITSDEISDLINDIDSQRLLVLVDACYAAATANVPTKNATVNLNQLFEDFDGTGKVMISGSDGSQLSLIINDPAHEGFGHSVFTWHLIAALRGTADSNSDGVITVEELWLHVKDRTLRTSRELGGKQTPRLQGEFGSKFLVAINAAKLTANKPPPVPAPTVSGVDPPDNWRESPGGKLIARLTELALGNQISIRQAKQGRYLLTQTSRELTDAERNLRVAFEALARGNLEVRKFNLEYEDLDLTDSQITSAASQLAIYENPDRFFELAEIYSDRPGMIPSLLQRLMTNQDFLDFEGAQSTRDAREIREDAVKYLRQFVDQEPMAVAMIGATQGIRTPAIVEDLLEFCIDQARLPAHRCAYKLALARHLLMVRDFRRLKQDAGLDVRIFDMTNSATDDARAMELLEEPLNLEGKTELEQHLVNLAKRMQELGTVDPNHVYDRPSMGLLPFFAPTHPLDLQNKIRVLRHIIGQTGDEQMRQVASRQIGLALADLHNFKHSIIYANSDLRLHQRLVRTIAEPGRELNDLIDQLSVAWGADHDVVLDLMNRRDRLNGKPAPELVGSDLNDQPIRLSDYRGKLVLLDLWAFW